MGPPEGNSLDIDTVSQNRLNATKKIDKFDLNLKKNVLETALENPSGIPNVSKSRFQQNLSNAVYRI